MRKFANAIFAVVIAATATLARAEFSYTLSGPSTAIVGETVTFELTGKYTPYDFSGLPQVIRDVPISYIHDGAQSNEYFSLLDINGSTALSSASWGKPMASRDEPAEFHHSFSWLASEAGVFDFVISGTNDESFSRIPDWSYCQQNNVSCGPLSDGYYIHDGLDFRRSVIVSAVPEPETFALMLAGLGVVGVVVRRRQTQRSSLG